MRYLYQSKKESGVMKMKYLEGEGGGVKGRTGWVMVDVPDAGTQITATVLGTDGKVYDTGDHVEEESGTQDEPELEETGDERTRRLRNLVRD